MLPIVTLATLFLLSFSCQFAIHCATIFSLENEIFLKKIHSTDKKRDNPQLDIVCQNVIDKKQEHCKEKAHLSSVNFSRVEMFEKASDDLLCFKWLTYYHCQVKEACEKCSSEQAYLVEQLSKERLVMKLKCRQLLEANEIEEGSPNLVESWCDNTENVRLPLNLQSGEGSLAPINQCAVRAAPERKKCMEASFRKRGVIAPDNSNLTEESSASFCQGTFEGHMCTVNWACGNCAYAEAHEVEDELKLMLDPILANCLHSPPEFSLNKYQCTVSHTEAILYLVFIGLLGFSILCLLVIICTSKTDPAPDESPAEQQPMKLMSEKKYTRPIK